MDKLNRQIKNKVCETSWRTGGDTANNTYGEIVTESFEEVKKTGRHAGACRLYDMYHPEIGALRKSKSYSSLAPTNGMEYKDRHVEPGLRPFCPYKTKQSEWRSKMEKVQHHAPAPKGKSASMSALPPLPPTYRRQLPVSADLTRFENFAIYWNSRVKGLDYSQPFLFEPHRDNYDIMEDRRYHRTYWAKKFIPHKPTARHARQIMLTAY